MRPNNDEEYKLANEVIKQMSQKLCIVDEMVHALVLRCE